MIKFFFKKISDEFALIQFSAAGLAFFTLLAMVPFLIVILTGFQSIGILEQFYPMAENFIFSTMKEATGNTASLYLKNTIEKVQFKTVGVTGIFFLLWTAADLLKNIDYAFHKIWGIKMTTPMLKRRSLYWVVILFMPILIMIASWVYSLKTLHATSPMLGNKFNLFLIGTFILWVLYTFVPSTKVNPLNALISSLVAGLFLMGLQNSFLWVALKLFKQNKIYGSLASFPIFLLWLLLVWIIILTGVSLCAFLQQKFFKRS